MNNAQVRAEFLSKQKRDIGIGVARASDGTLSWTIVTARPMA